MTALDAERDSWKHDVSMLPAIPAVPAGQLVPAIRPPKPGGSSLDRPPYAPDASHIIRFWLAGPLTLVLSIPLLGAGLFGAPAMIPGMVLAWRMLRSGEDDYSDFAVGGFQISIAALLISMLFGGGLLYAFGIIFGPLMAIIFRTIAGSWRPATPPAAYPPATMPDLARVPRTA